MRHAAPGLGAAGARLHDCVLLRRLARVYMSVCLGTRRREVRAAGIHSAVSRCGRSGLAAATVKWIDLVNAFVVL